MKLNLNSSQRPQLGLSSYNRVTTNGGGSGGGGDPHFANVISLLHFDGTNGSTTITDQIAGKTWGVAGSAALSTTDPEFGTACLLVPDSGKVLSNTDAKDAFGTGPFTVEFSLNPIAWGTDIIYDTRTTGTEACPALYYTGSALRYFVSGADRIIGDDIPTGSYVHIALCRDDASDTRLFINGVQTGLTWADTTNYTNNITAWGDTSYTAGNSINGRIDEARITKGVARYTSNFTPPSSPFPDS